MLFIEGRKTHGSQTEDFDNSDLRRKYFKAESSLSPLLTLDNRFDIWILLFGDLGKPEAPLAS